MTGQYVNLVTGLYRYFLSDIIPDIQGFSSIDLNATRAHGIRQISQTSLPSFG